MKEISWFITRVQELSEKIALWVMSTYCVNMFIAAQTHIQNRYL